ncbi:bile acid:sodium symporter family protein [Mycobacterium sp. TY815]|uniref:bile acid:sodium symporter family protein n=1 Tax=Mycobacterium sp. TY815 TaxID=3050581 RepID=UPI00274070C8|nr:membrane transporter protein [Mycobacterium sp. TY815]MDP7701823.1 membrane transporter protein [Mycobacterium sp. TY815]
MTVAEAAKLAFQISLFVVILGYGLTAQFSDVRYVLQRPGLLGRAILAVLIITPALAVLLVHVVNLRPQVAIALVTLAISPLPPLLPRRGEKAGGQVQFGLGLVIVLAVLAVPGISVAARVLGDLFGRDYVTSPWSVGKLLLFSVLLPLVTGMAIGKFWPAAASRIGGPIGHAQRWALPVAMIVLLVAAAPQMWKLLGDVTLLAMVIFVVGAFAVGHVLGGPDRQFSAVVAFASACRHPATALTIASANFPNADERGAVALYGVVTALVGVLYTRWLRRRGAASRA